MAAALFGLAYLYYLNFSPDRSRFPIRGIDVSQHQGAIDWQRVAADDVQFAVIKATEGGDHVDKNFAANFAAARQAGLAVGAYHFFTFCRPGAEQAANFLATVPRDQPVLPPVVDIEYGGNCAARPTIDELNKQLMAFLVPVEAAFGRQAVLYLSGGAENDYGPQLPKRALWVRQLAWYPGDDQWTYWQYHDRGRVAGIDGDVDLNVLKGDREMLDTLREPGI
jgi:lysozyme